MMAGPFVVALLATLLITSVASAANSEPIKLASASDGRTLKLGDIAADDDLLAVVFQERNHSYLRWSTNYGQTFSPRVALRSGLRAKEPRVAVCDDLIFSASVWQSDVTRTVGVDYRNIDTSESGRYSLGLGQMVDVACLGEVVAVTYVHEEHVWLAAHEGSCASPCSPQVKMDLGPADLDSPPQITADYGGFTATWITTGLAIQHFEYDAGSGGEFTLTPSPVQTLMVGKNVRRPVINSLGQRIVVAYSRDGQTHLRISDDVSETYGPRIIVSNFCRNCPEGGSHPDSVSVRGSDIVVEVIRAGGVPTAYEMVAFVSRNSGASWAKRSSRGGGFQRAVILEGSVFAEAWDAHFYNGFPYPETEQLIGFQVRDL
jgi:hypothetical protein